MPPPRKTGSSVRRGSGDVEEDPERATSTVARASNPLPAGEDPERANATVAKIANPLSEGDDPERENKTQAKVMRPPTKSRGSKKVGPVPEEPLDDGGGSYNTGQNYQAMNEGDGDGEEDLAGMSLDGDGLDALDPELAPKTRALPALKEREEEVPEEADDDNATRAGPPIKIEIVEGPDTGKKKKFRGVRMVVGRTPGVDLQLSDQSVSRRHIELVYSDEGTLLRDLGSGNGTRLNGKKIDGDTKLSHGDVIHIGKTKMRFVDELAAFKKVREDAEKKKSAPAKAEEKDEAKEGEEDAEAAEEKASDDEGAEEGEEEKDGGDDAEEGAASESDASESDATDADASVAKKAKKGKGARDRSKPVRTSRQSPAETGLAARFKALDRRVRLGIVGGAVVVLLLLIVGVATRKPPPPPVDTRGEQAALKMQEARNFTKEGKFEEAAKAVDEAEKLSPGIDKTRLGTQAREALNIQRNFEQVRTLITEKRFEDARKLLADTPKGNVKNEADRVKLEEAMEAALIEYKRAKAIEFLASGELDAARQLAAEIPADQLGDLPQQITDFERTLEETKAQEEKDAKLSAAQRAAAFRSRREEEVALAFAVVERKFGGGEWERAASECSRVIDSHSGDKDIINRAKSLGSQIPNFGKNFDEGMKKFRAGQLTAAAKPLRLAFQSYRAMGLASNRYGQEAEQALLKAAVAAGKEALIRDDVENAMANFREAKRIDASDPDVRKGFDGVADKAEDLYQSAYMVKDRDPREALRKFKTVIAVTESGSPVHEKAKNQVAAMAP